MPKIYIYIPRTTFFFCVLLSPYIVADVYRCDMYLLGLSDNISRLLSPKFVRIRFVRGQGTGGVGCGGFWLLVCRTANKATHKKTWSGIHRRTGCAPFPWLPSSNYYRMMVGGIMVVGTHCDVSASPSRWWIMEWRWEWLRIVVFLFLCFVKTSKPKKTAVWSNVI